MILDNVIQLIYGIPGVLTYIVVFYAMWSLRKVLSNSFMFLFVMTAVVNIVTFLNTWVYLKLQKEPFFDFYFRWLEEQPVVKQIHVLAVSHFYYAQNIDLLLLTFDRFVTITQLTDTYWWNKYYLLVVIAAQIIICPIHWASRNFPKAALFQSIYGGVIFSACLFLNILSIRYLSKMNKSSRTAHMSLFIISFLMFITQLLNLGIVISTAVGFSNLETLNRVYSVMMYTSDLFSLGQAVYTILLPGPMRHFVALKIWKISPYCSRQTVHVTTLTPSKNQVSK